MALDFSKKSDALFLDLVNTKATRALAANEITIGAPGAGTTGGKNTTVHLTAVAEAPNLKGEADFHFDRLDLTTLFTGHTLSVEVVDGIDSALEIAAALNAKFGLNISELDIEDTAIDVASEPASITLTALATGLVYTGSVEVALTYPKDDLNTVMGDGVADGFVAPTLTEA